MASRLNIPALPRAESPRNGLSDPENESDNNQTDIAQVIAQVIKAIPIADLASSFFTTCPSQTLFVHNFARKLHRLVYLPLIQFLHKVGYSLQRILVLLIIARSYARGHS